MQPEENQLNYHCHDTVGKHTLPDEHSVVQVDWEPSTMSNHLCVCCIKTDHCTCTSATIHHRQHTSSSEPII